MDRRPSSGFWSIPGKLLVLLLIAFLPAFAIIVSSSLAQRDRAIQEAEKGAMLLVRSLAAQQEKITDGTKQMLNTLAQLPEVKNLDSRACNELFSQLHRNYPAYSVIAALRPDGSVFASDPPFEPGTNLSDRKHVKDTTRTLDFSAGDYIMGRITKVPVIPFGGPVLGPDKELIAILVVGLRLDEYAHFLRNANLPEGSAVGIMDHKGIRLFRFPEKNGIGPGLPVPEDTFLKMSDGLESGTFERTGVDGVPRIYAFKQLRLREDYTPYLYVSVGYANHKIFQTANREMLGYLFILGTVVLLVMCVAWLFAHHLLILPIKQLVETSQLFGKGDLGTRTGLPHSPNEVGQLAKSFDDMASLLEIRDTESQRANEALRASEEMFRLLVENAPDAIFVQTQNLFAYVNPAAVRLFGAASPDQLVGKPSLDRVHPSSHETVRKRIHLLRAEKKPQANAEVQLIRIDGSIVDAESTAVPITYNGHNGALVFVRDISERKWAEKDVSISTA